MWRKFKKKKKVEGGGGHLKKRRERKEKQHEMRCLEHIPTGMVLLDTSKAFSCTKCIIHSALQLCHWQIETYPFFMADTDTSIMPRSHSESSELTQMPCSCMAHHLFKVVQITGHPHPTFFTNLSAHPQGHPITPMQTWI